MSVKSRIRAKSTAYRTGGFECSVIFPRVPLLIKMCKLKPGLCTYWIELDHLRVNVSSLPNC